MEFLELTGEIERSIHLWFANGTGPERRLARLYRESRSAGNRLQLSSFGGTATTALWAFLSTESPLVNHGPRNRFFKHEWRLGDEVLSGRRKAIYLVGNPILSVLSLQRRFGLRIAARENQIGARTAWGAPRSVEEYLAMSEQAGHDVLRFADHASAWLQAARLPESRIMVVHMESLWEQAERICAFSEIPEDRWDRFPPRKTRSSDLGSLDSKLLERLNNVLRDALRVTEEIRENPVAA